MPKSYIAREQLMTMQIRTAVGNSRKARSERCLRKYQKSGNDRIVRDADSGRARAQISQKHRDMTGEHECMNWQNLGMSNNDNKQDWADNEK